MTSMFGPVPPLNEEPERLEKISLSNLKEKTNMNLSYHMIKEIPQEFSQIANTLTKLDLKYNQIATLPFNFGNLRNMKHLDLKGNMLTTIPITMFAMDHLTYLNIGDNVNLIGGLKSIGGPCHNDLLCKECANRTLTFLNYLKVLNEEMATLCEGFLNGAFDHSSINEDLVQIPTFQLPSIQPFQEPKEIPTQPEEPKGETEPQQEEFEDDDEEDDDDLISIEELNTENYPPNLNLVGEETIGKVETISETSIFDSEEDEANLRIEEMDAELKKRDGPKVNAAQTPSKQFAEFSPQRGNEKEESLNKNRDSDEDGNLTYDLEEEDVEISNANVSTFRQFALNETGNREFLTEGYGRRGRRNAVVDYHIFNDPDNPNNNSNLNIAIMSGGPAQVGGIELGENIEQEQDEGFSSGEEISESENEEPRGSSGNSSGGGNSAGSAGGQSGVKDFFAGAWEHTKTGAKKFVQTAPGFLLLLLRLAAAIVIAIYGSILIAAFVVDNEIFDFQVRKGLRKIGMKESTGACLINTHKCFQNWIVKILPAFPLIKLSLSWFDKLIIWIQSFFD